MSIVKQIKDKNLTDATVAIHEALAEIRKSKLMELKWELGKTFTEARYVSDKPFKKSNVRDDPAEIMKHEEERNKKAAEERAAKKAAWENRKKQVDEVSKELVGRYIKKASKDTGIRGWRAGFEHGEEVGKGKWSAKNPKTYPDDAGEVERDENNQRAKREKGIERATDKLTGKAKIHAKEATIQEVSDALLKRYVKKGEKDAGRLAFSSKTHSMISKASDSATQKAYHQRASDQFDDKSAKRASNVMKARKKLGLHEVSKALLSRYRGKADDQVDRERARGNKPKMWKRITGIGKANQKLNPDGKAKVKATD